MILKKEKPAKTAQAAPAAQLQHDPVQTYLTNLQARMAEAEYSYKELLLQVDGVGGDDGFPAQFKGMAYGRYEVGQRFADAGSCLGQQSRAILQRSCHGGGHELLLGAILKTAPAGEYAGGRKVLLCLFGKPAHCLGVLLQRAFVSL